MQKKKVLTLLDPKVNDFEIYKGVDIIKPNKKRSRVGYRT